LVVPRVFSATIRVPQDQSTIQGGIDAAAEGDTVLISDGTFAGHGNTNLLFRDLDITVISEHGNQHTVIDCEGTARAFFVIGPLTEACTIEGLTIANGHSGNDGLGGGAMFVGGSSPRIVNCRFVGCYATGTRFGVGGGGAIIFHNSQAKVLDTVFSGNSADWLGGAVVARTSDLEIQGCQFDGNRAQGANSTGGAMAILTTAVGVHPRVSFCEMTNNQAGGGGALFADDALIDNCTISGNDAELGGGVYLINCVIARSKLSENTASLAGGGFFGGGWKTEIKECLIERNIASLGGGLRLSGACQVVSSIIVMNNAKEGGGAACSQESSSFVNCTIAMNSALEGSGMLLAYFESLVFSMSHSIIAFGEGGEAVRCEGPVSITADCTNIYGNAGGDWIDCLEGQEGASGNVSGDPLFCQSGLDWRICSNSPCAPEQSKCGIIGALPVGCGNCGVAVAPATWGQIKYQALGTPGSIIRKRLP
jgi:hypothetical protein